MPGSGVWWVRHVDADGKLRREKAGTWSEAEKLHKLRRAAALKGDKLPQLRQRTVPFSELCDDYLEYAKQHNEGKAVDKYRIQKLKAAFGDRAAEKITIAELRACFAAQKRKSGIRSPRRSCYRTGNRELPTVREPCWYGSSLGIENEKLEQNPARLLKHRREPDGVVRYLNQHSPDEESRLRKVVA